MSIPKQLPHRVVSVLSTDSDRRPSEFDASCSFEFERCLDTQQQDTHPRRTRVFEASSPTGEHTAALPSDRGSVLTLRLVNGPFPGLTLHARRANESVVVTLATADIAQHALAMSHREQLEAELSKRLGRHITLELTNATSAR